jgi:hypothetical protein
MTWQTTEPVEEKPRLVGIEPCVDWNLGPGRVDFFPRGEPQEWIPVLLRLKDISPRDFANGSKMFNDDGLIAQWRASVRVSPLYTELLPGLNPGFEKLEYITAHVKEIFFQILRDETANILGKFVDRVTISPPLSPRSFPDGKSTEPPPEQIGDPSKPPPGEASAGIIASGFEKLRHLSTLLKERFFRTRTQSAVALGRPLVIVGILDDGLAFAHERFREPGGGSRVEFFWMQDGIGPGPIGLAFGGLELRKPDLMGARGIDGLLSDCTFAGLVDEDEFYRRAGVIDFPISAHKAVTWRRAHGTHVLDLACGFPPQSTPNWRIIAVQLPIATTGLPVTSPLAKNLIDGIFYILIRSLDVSARLKCPPLPVVINISYGINAGPHDGTHIVESAIDFIIPLWQALVGVNVRVVIASGNSHLDRLHVKATFQPPVQIIDLHWRVLPDDQTPSVVEIWLPPGPPPPPSRIELSVFPPGIPPGGGGGTVPLGETGGIEPWPPAGTGATLCEVQYAYYLAPTGRGMFRITIQPTARIDSPAPVAPSGLWTIRLENKNNLLDGADIRAWIERDEAPYGYPIRGRQSHFDDPAYTRYDDAGRAIEVDNPGSVVKRAGSMNALATGVEPVVMGGMMRKELRPSKYSAGGPIPPLIGPPLPPHQDGPDALTVSDDSTVHAGVLAAGTRSGSVVAMNGTSVAAPTITREVARMLSIGGNGSRFDVQALATAQEVGLPPPKPAPQRGGAGRIILPPIYPLPRSER